jgi:hypothetical protein
VTSAPSAQVAPAEDTTPRPGSRAARARMPLARDVVTEAAISHGVCVRPVAMRVTDVHTGEVRFVDVPCGSTLASRCASCAERARRLRMHQCREGWHLDHDPFHAADPPTEGQKALAVERADITAARDECLDVADEDTAAACRESLADVDADLRKAGVRGAVEPPARERRVRSTRRRQDAPDLPKKAMENTTLGRAFVGRDGTVFRPSLFLTVTLPSYGRVREDGTPVDPGSYDYTRAARDALAFSRLLDRLVQNLRRVAGYDVQYFATVEPQRRLAAHAHFAIRGTIPRALIRQVVAATYHQVWWPTTGDPVYSPDRAPVWTPDGYADPGTGELLPTWDEALDQLDDPDAMPRHVVRFGPQTDIQGLLAGTPEADRRIGYLAKYLTKSMGEAHDADSGPQKAHLDRLHAALAVEPCSPACPNWLRYGIQPKSARPGQTPGGCRSKAHKREHLGYAGRRILVSRKWSGKTLADHRHDRRAWVLATLGVTDQPGDMRRDRYEWERADPDDPIRPLANRLLHAIAQRQRWRAAYDAAKRGDPPPPADSASSPPGVKNALTSDGTDSATPTHGRETAA